MAGSVYLTSGEYAEYGLPATVTAAQVAQAGALVDAYLSRSRGLVWSPDAAGAPACMAAATASLVLVGTGSVASGSGVVVPYTGPTLDNNSIGEIVVLDRLDETKIESCVVTAVGTLPSTVTLQTVQFAHDAACTIEFGLTLFEQREMPAGRSVTRLSEHPIMRLLSGAGRYGYGRRSDQISGYNQDFNLLASVSTFGGPPLWTTWSVSDASVTPSTGEVWIPSGIMMAYYSEVRVWYVAGYSEDRIPSNIKQATANIVAQLKETGLGANVRQRAQRDGVSTSRFENNLIDVNTREILAPFRARNFS